MAAGTLGAAGSGRWRRGGRLLPWISLVAACRRDETDTGPAVDSGTAAAGAFTALLPVEAAGGSLAVRVFHPATPRWPEGAPVAVVAPGGWGAGSLHAEVAMPEVEDGGWVQVEVLLPGGAQEGVASGGHEDQRGEASAEALRAAIRYAAGVLADVGGAAIGDRCPVALAGPVGVLGISNGSNLALLALAGLGAADPEVAWLVAWEGPVGDQLAAVELNDNPYYVPGTCGPTTCPWPGMAEVLAFSEEGRTLPLNDPGEPDDRFPGLLFLDADGDGTPDEGERAFDQMVMGTPDGDPRMYPSDELSAALAAHGALALPAWLAGAEAAAAFWAARDGAPAVPAVHARFPGLIVLHVGSVEDHVQTQPDQPHARAHVAAWLAVGHAFVRVNADAAYMAMVTGQDASSFPDNPAGEPLPWPGTEAWMEPEVVGGVRMDPHTARAAVLEAMDRARAGDRSPDLEGVLAP